MPSFWLPDAAPASPGAQDDEFDDSSLAGAWTETDHGSTLTVTEDDAGLALAMATHAGSGIAGIRKTIPAGDFTYWTRVAMSGLVPASTLNAGIALWQDATDVAGDVRALMLRNTATQGEVQVQTYTAYNAAVSAFATASAMTVDVGPSGLYLMVRRTGTTYAFSFSTDGRGWQRIVSTASLGITPTHIGPAIDNANSGGDMIGRFAFWRYLASDVGLTPLMQGARIFFAAA